jgi:internalin A
MRLQTISVLLLLLGSTGASASQDEAIETIQKFGGTVEVDATQPGKPVIKVDLHQTTISDADLAVLAAFPDLQILDLRLTRIGDEGVVHLKNLKKLRFLNLFRSQLTDTGLTYLNRMSELETLLIGGTKVSDKGMVHLKSFKTLKKISLFDTQVGDAGLDQLAGLAKLQVLLLEKSQVTEAGIKRIEAALPGLKFQESVT